MAKIRILASITDPARPDRENEDRLGWNENAAFVVDGASSLGEPVVEPPRSDAAWLAEHAAEYLRAGLTTGRDTASVVRELNDAARVRFVEACRGVEVERYRHPTAAFQSVRTMGDEIEIAGLGDCVLFLVAADGTHLRSSALTLKRSREQYFARKALAQSGGYDEAGIAYHEQTVLSGMRSARAKHNLPGGSVWTLGLEPIAADHLTRARLRIAVPATCILCTDGFADLVDGYALHTIDSLVDTACTAGLESLLAQLRDLERNVDPAGVEFPRFKQSDDASALLLRFEA